MRLTLTNSDTGQTVLATPAGAAVLQRRGYQPAGATGPEKPDENAKRGDWDEYARSLGLNPDDYPSKGKLIAAIEQGNS